MDTDRYFGIGRVLGGITAFITFWAAWIYCMSHYGFLLGFGLGWLPASILAGILGLAVTVLWGPALLVVALGVFALLSQQQGSTATAEPPASDAAIAAAAADTAQNAAGTAAEAAADAAAAAAVAASSGTAAYTGSAGSGAYVAGHGSAACTDDCSGHDAGYTWAEDNDISDEDDCGGKSVSFEEGCRAYVEDNGDEDDDDEDE